MLATDASTVHSARETWDLGRPRGPRLNDAGDGLLLGILRLLVVVVATGGQQQRKRRHGRE